MIKEENGKWRVECSLCSWSNIEDDEQEAKQALSRHLSVTHRESEANISDRNLPAPPSKLPPNLPEPIKPQGKRKN